MKKSPYSYQPASLIFNSAQFGSHPLLLGDAQSPLTQSLLKKYSVATVISIGQEAAPSKKFPGISYHLVKLRDQKDQPLKDLLNGVTELIETSREKGGVLIHCYHGVSRSASFVIAYTMRKLDIPFEEAKQLVKKNRSCISPNSGFVIHLKNYEKQRKPNKIRVNSLQKWIIKNRIVIDVMHYQLTLSTLSDIIGHGTQICASIKYSHQQINWDQMNEGHKPVEIYLRVKGPKDPFVDPQFKITRNDTRIRFKDNGESQEQEIMNDFTGAGSYKFDKIFREDCMQEEIFECVAKDLVQSALEGYNGTIFAYGQTGSGKTYTMTGGDGEPETMGLIPRVIDYLYKQIEIREEDFSVQLRYMQIYKASGYDLLHPQAKNVRSLQRLQRVQPITKQDGFDFKNLSEVAAPNFEEAMRIFEYGQTNRIVCKTPSNDQSSRSHCILMILLKSRNRETGILQRSTINLVDLAGSERIHNSGMDQKLAMEGININLGLHFLGRVIVSLGNRERNQFIPYRDSLLTMALKSSLGGNCKTRMIATINPKPYLNPQNEATCRFSQQLLAMENKVKKNQFIDPWLIIRGLKQEVEDLRNQLILAKGEKVKDALDRSDMLEIKRLVDEYLQSNNASAALPLNDRLYIVEYLNYMKKIIRGKKIDFKQKNAKDEQMNPESAILCDNYVMEIKNLRNLVQQKQNEINLLLSIINDKKAENPAQMDDDNHYLQIEEPSEKKIAEAVVKSLLKDTKKRSLNLSTQEVQKHLLKPIQLNEQDNIEEAFKKFKDAHMKTEAIEEKDCQIKLKNMKKDTIAKKLQNLKFQRARLQEKIDDFKKGTKIKHKDILPNLLSSTREDQSQLQLSEMNKQLTNLEDHIRKKHKQLKSLELQISKLGLGKNKNVERMKMEFDEYMGDKIRRPSEESINIEQREEEKDDMDFQGNSIEDEVNRQLNSFMVARNQLRRGR